MAAKAYNHLLDKLLTNQFVPGEILNRREVARELGMSVAPILEAMLQLEAHGFLSTLPRKGTQVKPIRTEDVIGSLIVREALECQAARLYCGERVYRNLERLTPIAEKLDNSQARDPEHWNKEIEFHGTLVSLAEYPMLCEEFSRSIRLSTFYGLHRLSSSVGEEQRSHRALLDELTKDDPDNAERVIRSHTRSGKGELVSSLR